MAIYYSHLIYWTERPFTDFLLLLFFYSAAYLSTTNFDSIFFDDLFDEDANIHTLKIITWIIYSISLFVGIFFFFEPMDLSLFKTIYNLNEPVLIDAFGGVLGFFLFTVFGVNIFIDRKFSTK